MPFFSKPLCVFYLALFLAPAGIVFLLNDAASANSKLPIIPGAAGFGITTVGGSGRHQTPPRTQIFKVTHLGAKGPGSLQACIFAKGPRTCVFEVGGTIDLTGDRNYKKNIEIYNPYLTIAGQTAPSPGITVKGKEFRIRAHDILIQHIKIRMGDHADAGPNPWVRHAIQIIGKKRLPFLPHNIVIDHCSVSWGIDETLTAKSNAKNITIRRSIISEGLAKSLHPKGYHSMGLMASADNMTISGNILAHTADRNPLDTSPHSVIVNNLIYNDRSRGIQLVPIKRATSIVGNKRISGPDTQDQYAVDLFDQPSGSQIFVKDNICEAPKDNPWACVEHETKAGDEDYIKALRAKTPPVWNKGLKAIPASRVEQAVLADTGARPKDRDEIDRRVVNDILTRSGHIPNCVGPTDILYPKGQIIKAAPDSLEIRLPYCYEKRFVGQQVLLTKGPGAGQTRRISAHTCKPSRLKVDKKWDTMPTPETHYAVRVDCSKNAGGWPKSTMSKRALDLPKRPHDLMPSGYTRLEHYLHKQARQLENADLWQSDSLTMPVAGNRKRLK